MSYILKYINEDFYLLDDKAEINYDDWFFDKHHLSQKHLNFNESDSNWRKVIASTKPLSGIYNIKINPLMNITDKINFSFKDIKESFDTDYKTLVSNLHYSKEWKVDIRMRSKNIDELRESREGFLNNPNLWIPDIEHNCISIQKFI